MTSPHHLERRKRRRTLGRAKGSVHGAKGSMATFSTPCEARCDLRLLMFPTLKVALFLVSVQSTRGMRHAACGPVSTILSSILVRQDVWSPYVLGSFGHRALGLWLSSLTVVIPVLLWLGTALPKPAKKAKAAEVLLITWIHKQVIATSCSHDKTIQNWFATSVPSSILDRYIIVN